MTTVNNTYQGGVPTTLQGTINPPVGGAVIPSEQPLIGSTVSPNVQAFPVRTLKVFGGIQIGLGVLLGILSLIGVIIESVQMNKGCNSQSYYKYYDYYNNQYVTGYSYSSCWRWYHYSHSVFAFDITCLICSGWFILTGFLPLCMSKKRESSWRCLRVGFMVCSIIGASVFVPTVFSLGVVGAIIRGEYNGKVVVLSAFMAAFSFAELVIAIIAASYCCCCTPWGSSNQPVRIVYMNASQPGMIINLPQTQIPMTSLQPNVMTFAEQPANAALQYPGAQQYQVISSNQPPTQQVQLVATNQPGANDVMHPQVVLTDPPPYKE